MCTRTPPAFLDRDEAWRHRADAFAVYEVASVRQQPGCCASEKLTVQELFGRVFFIYLLVACPVAAAIYLLAWVGQ